MLTGKLYYFSTTVKTVGKIHTNVRERTHHNWANTRIQARANYCTDEILIITPLIARTKTFINQTSILKQKVKLLSKWIDGFHRLSREEILPAVLISRMISFSVFPTIECSNQSEMVAVVSARELGFRRICKLNGAGRLRLYSLNKGILNIKENQNQVRRTGKEANLLKLKLHTKHHVASTLNFLFRLSVITN